MALVLKDRVQEVSTTSGTGTLTLSGAVSGFQTFSTAIGNGNTTYYTIFDSTAYVWEVGIGTVGAGTLARTTILANSSGTTSALNLAGNTAFVFCTYPAGKSINYDADGVATIGSTLGYTDTGIIASFASTVAGYNQVVLQNKSTATNASTNFNVSNDAGTAGSNYAELGINSSTFTGTGSFNIAGASYVASASTDLTLGTYGAYSIHFVTNSSTTDAMTIFNNGGISLGGFTNPGIGNMAASKFVPGYTSVTAAAGTTTLTASSNYYQNLVGTTTQTFKLPDATGLLEGTTFIFDNDSTGTLTVVDDASGSIETVPSGAASFVYLADNATVAGTWRRHAFLPASYDFNSTTANFGNATITNAVWNGTTIASGYGGTGLTSFTAANNALYSTSASALVAGTLPIAAGGTAKTTFTANGVVYGDGTNPLGVTAAGTTGQVLVGNTGGAPSWATVSSSLVSSFSAGTTGFTPSTATTGAVTLAGTLNVANGGTGQTTYTNGQLLIGNTTGNTLTKATLTGTASQVDVTNGTGSITLSLPATINVNTSGSAATLTTSRNIYGNAFNGSANVTGIIASSFGGTGNGFTAFTGPATTEKIFTLPNATATILTTNAAVTIAQGGTGQTTATAAFDALNPMTTVGDIIYEATGPTATRLPIGTTGQVLTVSGGIPSWATPSANVSSISFGSTGLTPSTATTGVVTVAGTLAVTNGGTGATTAPNARTNLGATTVGSNLFTLTNPSAITFPRFNADNTVSTLNAADFRTAIGAGTGNGTVTSVAALTLGTTGTDLSSTVATGTTTPVITLNVPTASATNRGVLSSTDWTTFNNKGNGTVTSVAALTLGTTGTDLSSTVATGTTTPVITLNVPTASATNRGVLSSTDWTTFNNKGNGTVTSVSWTGGIVSVATATSTPAFTIAGTSGGIPYFSSASTWASSGVLAANALVIGGGAGVAPSTTTTGTGVLTALGVAINGSGGFVTDTGTVTLTNKTISADNNTLSGIAASSFVLSNASGNIDGAAAQKAIPSGEVVGTTDTQTLSGKTLTDPVITGTITEDVFTITDAAGFAIDPTNGSIQLITLGANRTPTQANWAAGESITLMVDDGTARTITWTTIGVVWVGGTAPTLALTGYTVIELWKVGTTIYGALVGAVA